MRIGLNVTGGQEWARALNQLPQELQKRALYDALHRSAGVVQRAVIAAAPVGTEPTRKTRRIRSVRVLRGRATLRLAAPQSVSYDYGRLRQNISRRRLNARRTGEIAVRVGRGKAFWAFFLEKGTSRMRAQPFWLRAAAGVEAQARAQFAADFRAAVAAALNRTYRAPRR